ncbi:uncharacterized protein LOC107814588 [Nicotiana tabacum]|uniref:Uncharacterized protein LOC107814588 n=5 Tax=Nicotiana TaxID=4085 RepID=A0AC58UUC9_TOBAC|nr:PREDICTED: uncharacterized protein LOC104243171 [Nicotiana sylvestris]
MENRPVDVPESHFKDLFNYWNSDPHKEKKKEISDTSDTVSSKDMFVATRKRKLGRVYKSSYDNTISKIAEIERIQSTQESEDVSHSIDAFASVMGPEHPRSREIVWTRGYQDCVKRAKRESWIF